MMRGKENLHLLEKKLQKSFLTCKHLCLLNLESYFKINVSLSL